MKLPKLLKHGAVLGLAVSLSCLSPLVHARKGDLSAPVQVKADQSDFDQHKGTQIFKGNVVVSQGSLRITADRIEVRLKNNRLDSIHASGSPARFEQENDLGQRISGQCDGLDYIATQKRLTLKGNAKLSQPGRTLKGHAIEFDVEASTVRAKGQGKKQVTIIIQPPKE